MSLWSSERVGVVLYADGIAEARVRAGRLLSHDVLPLPQPDRSGVPWRPVVAALAERVASGAYARAQVSVVLSSRFVSYVLVPGSELLRDEEARLAFVRQRCVALHGAQAESWRISIAPAPRGAARLACAVDDGLLASLTAVMAPLGKRHRSMQPLFAAAFNRWRRALGRAAAWFVVHERGLLTVALVERGRWASLRSIPADDRWPQRLTALLARAQCLADVAEPVTRVLLVADDEVELPQAQPWRIEWLRTEASRGAQAACAAAGMP